MWTAWLVVVLLGDAGVFELELGWHMCEGMQWDNRTAREGERAEDANAETTSNN
jgi:hypothetical protein